MLPPQKVTSLPEAPAWIRGVIKVRNETFPLVDFRKRIGVQGSLEEKAQLIEELKHREKEHLQWLAMLEESIHEDKEFKGEKDPHKCRFGRWYDSYEAPSASVQLELKKFDEPHRLIHATADEALSLKESGRIEDAKDIIRQRKNGVLARMVSLFQSLRQHIEEGGKEVVVLLEEGSLKYSMIVDRVESVETLALEENSALRNFQREEGSFARHARIAKRGERGNIVYVVDPAWIIEGGEELPLDQSE
jgi:purine-binding chemotaxis protein CheW